MNKEDEPSHRQGRPHNPGLRELIANKRQWCSTPKRQDAMLGFRGWHERGYLPHRDEPGLTQVVTFHLADSFPTNLRAEWAALLQIENDEERRKQRQAYLDKGRGACHLRLAHIGQLVDEALRYHHEEWYELRAWVVMPNHVHVLFQTTATPMSRIVKEWKRYTSREAKRLLNQAGPFWAKDYWDTYMRDAAHEAKACRYIESNPTKAFLVREPKEWPWTSARFRDEFGQLQM